MGNTHHHKPPPNPLPPSPAASAPATPLNFAPQIAPSLISAPPTAWPPPRRMVSPPLISPGCAPAPLAAAISLRTKIAQSHHHYAVIAGAAAAAVLLALLVLAVLVLRKKRRPLPQCIGADEGPTRPHQEESVATTEENTKRDSDISKREEHVMTVNVLNSPGNGNGRRRANAPAAASSSAEFTSPTEQSANVFEKQEAAAEGAEIRNEEVSKSGRILSERNAKSVRTRNFATVRTN